MRWLIIPLCLALLAGCSALTRSQIQLAESSPKQAFSLGNQLYAAGELKEGIKWIQHSADQNYVPAQYALGLLFASGLYSEGGAEEAEYYLTQASESGSHQASFKLAEFYRMGIIGDPDPQKSVPYYEAAINQGSMDARKALGVMYLRGIGIEKNEPKGKELLSVFPL